MKVLLLNGSPNEHGCTYTALCEVARALEESGVETETLWIGNRAVRGCIGCGGCAKNGRRRCVFEDDLVNAALDRMQACDGLVVGSPVHYAAAGGSIITSGGLVFIGAATDRYLRAFDMRDGREVWRQSLPAAGNATPISYVLPNGRQYVVIAAGGHGYLGTKGGDYLMAFALKE